MRVCTFLLLMASTASAARPRLTATPAEPALYARFEIAIQAERGDRPFDPTVSDVTATFTTPSRKQVIVHGFYYEPFDRTIVKDKKGEEAEQLDAAGPGDWRIRYCPTEIGRHLYRVVFKRDNVTLWQWEGVARVRSSTGSGFVHVEPMDRRSFEFDTGLPLFLLGECCCWGGRLGTFSYDTWFAIHRSSGMNAARIWMSPWAFGIEATPKSLANYSLDQAWALDYVVDLAARQGIYLVLCLDYHGMLRTRKDQWGKNDNWHRNPYNKKLGGPCRTPGQFFTSREAKELYRNRLRYIVARWGYSTHVLAWELWNEVDLAYSERGVDSKAVEVWHQEMARYLKRIDPNRHLVTTSFYSDKAAERVWRMPEMDFVQNHCYNRPDPAGALTQLAADMFAKYHKPVLVGEYGVESAGAKRTLQKDPLGEALHQALWSSALSGSAGAAMPWWWDNYIHPEGLHVIWRNLSEFLDGVPMGAAGMKPARFEQASRSANPKSPQGKPFTVRLLPETNWDKRVAAKLLDIAAPDSLGKQKVFHAFLQGRRQAKRRQPVQIRAAFAKHAAVRMHLNSVSYGAVLSVSVDGHTVYSKRLRNRDRRSKVRKEYNTTLTAQIPRGAHTVTIENRGGDWLYLDWIDVANVLPSSIAARSPRVRPFGIAWPSRAVVWLLNEDAAWPKNPRAPVRDAKVTLLGMEDGEYRVEWRDPPSSAVLGREHVLCKDGKLRLSPPEFLRDIAGKMRRVK